LSKKKKKNPQKPKKKEWIEYKEKKKKKKKTKTADRYISHATRLIVNVIVYNNRYNIVIIYVSEMLILYRMYHETMSF